jgi:type II secretory pathway component GspD/PulD (secretin)
MKLARGILALTLVAAFSGPLAWAQAAPAAPKPSTDAPSAKPATPDSEARFASEHPCQVKVNTALCPERTFYLKNASQVSEANEIQTALRNTLPSDDKLFLIPNQNAIIVLARPEDVSLAEKLIAELDHPKKNYRLTYTLTELDGTKPVGTQHFSMVLVSGQETTLKQGSKIPVATGSYTAGGPNGENMSPVQTQFTYLDVGMNFDATLTAMGENAMLKSSVEDTSAAPERSEIAGVREPIVRQSTLKGESLLAPGKPLALGSMDIPGSTTHLQIEVLMDPLP